MNLALLSWQATRQVIGKQKHLVLIIGTEGFGDTGWNLGLYCRLFMTPICGVKQSIIANVADHGYILVD